MPGQMPEMLSRGANLQTLDNLLSRANGQQDAILKTLVDMENNNPDPANLGTALLNLTIAHNIFPTAQEQDHFRDDWLGMNWWKEAQPAAPVLVRGFIRALQKATALKLDIETLWVCTPPLDDGTDFDTGRIHVAHTWSKNVVIVVIHTPKLPEQRPPTAKKDPVLVVRWNAAKNGFDEESPS